MNLFYWLVTITAGLAGGTAIGRALARRRRRHPPPLPPRRLGDHLAEVHQELEAVAGEIADLADEIGRSAGPAGATRLANSAP